MHRFLNIMMVVIPSSLKPADAAVFNCITVYHDETTMLIRVQISEYLSELSPVNAAVVLSWSYSGGICCKIFGTGRQ
jgi:hypothetical protein